MQAQGLVVQVNVSMCVLMTGHPGDNCAPGFLEPFTKKCLKCTKNAYSDPRNPGAGRGWRGGGGAAGRPGAARLFFFPRTRSHPRTPAGVCLSCAGANCAPDQCLSATTCKACAQGYSMYKGEAGGGGERARSCHRRRAAPDPCHLPQAADAHPTPPHPPLRSVHRSCLQRPLLPKHRRLCCRPPGVRRLRRRAHPHAAHHRNALVELPCLRPNPPPTPPLEPAAPLRPASPSAAPPRSTLSLHTAIPPPRLPA